MSKDDLDKLQRYCQQVLATVNSVAAGIQETQHRMKNMEEWVRDVRHGLANIDAGIRERRQRLELIEEGVVLLTDEVLPAVPPPTKAVPPFAGGGPDFEIDISAAIEGILRG